ncbi:MAG: response regulator [Candidatus Liptonbacteria bacterium]|nr:response regulator [Candidatus Liptonbacteria bacterium]
MPSARKKPVVLVVDDEAHFLEIMRLKLAASGFKPAVFQCDTAAPAAEQCMKLMPDLVLLDIYLAGKPTGLDAAYAIKKNPKTQGVRILFWSSFNRAALEGFGKSYRADIAFEEGDFLDKTADLQMVTTRIREALTHEV